MRRLLLLRLELLLDALLRLNHLLEFAFKFANLCSLLECDRCRGEKLSPRNLKLVVLLRHRRLCSFELLLQGEDLSVFSVVDGFEIGETGVENSAGGFVRDEKRSGADGGAVLHRAALK